MHPQNAISGKDLSGAAIDSELAGAVEMRKLVDSIHPRRNRKDYAHMLLMMDIRINYLRFKQVEFAFERGELNRNEVSVRLKPLSREGSRLQRRFIRLNRKSLKDPSIPLGGNSYLGKMRKMV